jgi:hypothetical protein
MGDSAKALLSAVLAFSTLLVTAALWRHPLGLIVLVFLVGCAIFLLRPTVSSLVVYAVGFAFGPLAEILGIHAGAWRYSAPDFLGIPIWLPFVWGNAALFILNAGEVATTALQSGRLRGPSGSTRAPADAERQRV